MRSYIAKKLLDVDEIFERQLVRRFVLVSANAMMTFGEPYQSTRGNVKILKVERKRLAQVSVKGETSKVGQSGEITARDGEYVDRLKYLSEHTKKSDFAFTRHCGEQITKYSMYRRYPYTMELQNELKVARQFFLYV